jgi:hypothetical protein
MIKMQNYNPNLLYGKQSFNSVISDGCNLVDAFNRVLSYYDPNKGKNYKTSILDCSYSLMLAEKDARLYKTDKTKNLTGTVTKNKYDVIIYEPPKNKTFYQDAINSSKIFVKLLKPDGIVIVKMNDFKDGASKVLCGSFEIWDIFSDEGLYLYDNIVYNFHRPSNTCDVHDRAEIVHSNFMIFKKKQGDKNEVSKN